VRAGDGCPRILYHGAVKLHRATGSPNSRKVTSLIGSLGLTVDVQLVDLRQGEQRTDAFLAGREFLCDGWVPQPPVGP
jgi:hypothetical protein